MVNLSAARTAPTSRWRSMRSICAIAERPQVVVHGRRPTPIRAAGDPPARKGLPRLRHRPAGQDRRRVARLYDEFIVPARWVGAGPVKGRRWAAGRAALGQAARPQRRPAKAPLPVVPGDVEALAGRGARARVGREASSSRSPPRRCARKKLLLGATHRRRRCSRSIPGLVRAGLRPDSPNFGALPAALPDANEKRPTRGRFHLKQPAGRFTSRPPQRSGRRSYFWARGVASRLQLAGLPCRLPSAPCARHGSCPRSVRRLAWVLRTCLHRRARAGWTWRRPGSAPCAGSRVLSEVSSPAPG